MTATQVLVRVQFLALLVCLHASSVLPAFAQASPVAIMSKSGAISSQPGTRIYACGLNPPDNSGYIPTFTCACSADGLHWKYSSVVHLQQSAYPGDYTNGGTGIYLAKAWNSDGVYGYVVTRGVSSDAIEEYYVNLQNNVCAVSRVGAMTPPVQASIRLGPRLGVATSNLSPHPIYVFAVEPAASINAKGTLWANKIGNPAAYGQGSAGNSWWGAPGYGTWSAPLFASTTSAGNSNLDAMFKLNNPGDKAVYDVFVVTPNNAGTALLGRIHRVDDDSFQGSGPPPDHAFATEAV